MNRQTNKMAWALMIGLSVSPLGAQEKISVEIKFSPEDYRYVQVEGGTRIVCNEGPTDYTWKVGEPELPVKTFRFIIPPNAKLQDVKLEYADSLKIPGSWKIKPVEPPKPFGYEYASNEEKDSKTLEPDKPYPVFPVVSMGTATFDGARLATVTVCPFRYRLSKGELFLYTHIKLTLVLKDTLYSELRVKYRSPFLQEIYDNIMKSIVQNTEDIPKWYIRPASDKGVNDTMVMIITTEAQKNNSYLQDYATWLRERGFSVGIQTMEWINANVSGVDEAQRLRNYIKMMYELGTSFFFLFGHEDDVPYRILGPVEPKWDPWERYNMIPADIYFADLDINWNPNSDGYWGVYNPNNRPEWPPTDVTPTQVAPEVFVGRITAKTVPFVTDEIANWVNKILVYSKNPANARGITQVLSSSHPSFPSDDNIIASGFPDNFSIHHEYTAYGTLNYVNNTPIGVMYTVAHGAANKAWYLQDAPFYGNPEYGSPNVGQFTNKDGYFVHYSVACIQTAYDDYPDGFQVTDTTVGEAFVEALPNKAAIASLSHTRLGWSITSAYFAQSFFANLLNPDSGTHYLLGPALVKTQIEHASTKLYECYSLNLFGSPTTEIWTDVPVENSMVSVSPSNIEPGVPTTVTVSFSLSTLPPTPIEGAKVTLYGCGVHTWKQTGPDGKATFTITPSSSGTIVVTAKKHNYLPKFANIYVGTGKGAGLAATGNASQGYVHWEPKQNLLYLSFAPNEEVSVAVFSITGRLVYQKRVTTTETGSLKIALSLRRGVYYYKITTRKGIIKGKLIVKD